jgi:enamine deaminase RidA (YjgF/YER057c/UK114 family)
MQASASPVRMLPRDWDLEEGACRVNRTDVNPWEWSKAFGFSQAVEMTGVTQLLVCSGQTAMGADGALPEESEMGAQVSTAFENLRTVLETAGLGPADVIRINYYTTDVDELIAVLGPLAGAFLGSNIPASTLLGVSRLAFPELKIEIEAVAAR